MIEENEDKKHLCHICGHEVNIEEPLYGDDVITNSPYLGGDVLTKILGVQQEQYDRTKAELLEKEGILLDNPWWELHSMVDVIEQTNFRVRWRAIGRKVDE